jgi:hypothetical protein
MQKNRVFFFLIYYVTCMDSKRFSNSLEEPAKMFASSWGHDLLNYGPATTKAEAMPLSGHASH